MAAQIAFYKGPPRNAFWHLLSHYAIRLWTWSKWSHAELVIDGLCLSSSVRDGGVRAKHIDLESGRWDVVSINIDEQAALNWFHQHDSDKYDWAGIWRFVIPLLPHHPRRQFCFEAIGNALGFAGAHKLTANDLWHWAANRQHDNPVLQEVWE